MSKANDYYHAKIDIENMLRDEVCPVKYVPAVEVAYKALDAMGSLEYCVKSIIEIFSEENAQE
jgi:hypothetical protein